MKTILNLLALLLVSGLSVAHATTRTWTGGGGDNFWSTSANWGGVAPLAGDDLVFPFGNTRFSNTNNFASGTTFNSILFTGTNYTLNGNSIFLNAGVTNSAPSTGNNIISFPITLTASQTFTSPGSGASVLALSGGITNGGNTLTCAGITVIISGVISGSGGIQSSAGTLLLGGANTYLGTTLVTGGFLVVNNGLALGDTNAGTIVSGGNIGFQSNVSVPEPISVSGAIFNFSQTNTLTGKLTLNLSSNIVDVRTNSMLILSNVVDGPGGLFKTNAGALRLAGGAGNTYGGSTTITRGTLLLAKAAGSNAIPAALTSFATVRLAAPDQIANTALVTLGSEGVLDLSSNAETIGSLSGTTNSSVILGTGNLTVGGDGSSTTFRGVISGTNGSLMKLGGGAFTLTGTNTYTGSTTASGGTLIINGLQTNSPVAVNGGTLGGTGSVGTVTASLAGAIVSPGASPGILNSLDVSLSAATTFNVELNGLGAGSSYDQLNVKGAVNLNNCILSPTLGFSPPFGATFTIITNDGADAVVGIFNGLPQNGLLTNGATILRVSYTGGDGNDVVLTSISGAPPSTLTSIVSLTNGFQQLTGVGQSNLTYTIQAASNLNPVIHWSDIGASTGSVGGVFFFTDTNAPLFPMRFYRAFSP